MESDLKSMVDLQRRSLLWLKVNAGIFGLIAALLLILMPKIWTTLGSANGVLRKAEPVVEKAGPVMDKVPVLAENLGTLTEATTEATKAVVDVKEEIEPLLEAGVEKATAAVKEMSAEALGAGMEAGAEKIGGSLRDRAVEMIEGFGREGREEE